MTRSLSFVIGLLAIRLLTAEERQPIAARLDGSTLVPAQIDAKVTQLMGAAHVTGIGIATFHRSEISYLQAYGLRDTEKRLPFTPESVLTAASLSKAAFATLLMQLVQEACLPWINLSINTCPNRFPSSCATQTFKATIDTKTFPANTVESHQWVSKLARIRGRP